MIRLCVSGLGRTGLSIARYLWLLENAQLVSCLSGNSQKECDLGVLLHTKNTGIPVYSAKDIARCIAQTRPDVVIDFSTPAAALQNAPVFFRAHIRAVMATTGFSPAQEEQLSRLVRQYKAGLVRAPNISCGINVLMFLSELAARLLPQYDVDIIELHHKHKKDAPSGTAEKLASQLADSRPPSAPDVSVMAVRAGGIVGEHKVLLSGENDILEITHRAQSREAFAEGALLAANFIAGKTGLYEMKDALGLNNLLPSLAEEASLQSSG